MSFRFLRDDPLLVPVVLLAPFIIFGILFTKPLWDR
jgi:hypothetical protein